jgi:hypothetical protein
LPAETERVNCYDALAQRNLRPPETGTAGKPEEPKPVEDLPAPPEPVTEPSSAQTVEITDDIGSEQVDGGNDAEAAVYHARVTSCQPAARRTRRGKSSSSLKTDRSGSRLTIPDSDTGNANST